MSAERERGRWEAAFEFGWLGQVGSFGMVGSRELGHGESIRRSVNQLHVMDSGDVVAAAAAGMTRIESSPRFDYRQRRC
jgi:hypothetical protein